MYYIINIMLQAFIFSSEGNVLTPKCFFNDISVPKNYVKIDII